MNCALISHVYNTEDTLYQIIFDKRFRREIYNLKTAKRDGQDDPTELNKRYSTLVEKYKTKTGSQDLDSI